MTFIVKQKNDTRENYLMSQVLVLCRKYTSHLQVHLSCPSLVTSAVEVKRNAMPPAAVSACGVLPCNFQNKT